MAATLINVLTEISKNRPYATVKDGSRDWAIGDLINAIDDEPEPTFAARETEDGRIHIYPMRWDGLCDENGQPWFTVLPTA